MRFARYALSSLLVLSWGLWVGGLVTLFMLVSSVFATLAPDRAAAGSITAPMFGIFERYQLALAAVAVAAVIGLRLISCSRGKTVLMALLLLAAVIAVGQTALVSSRMEVLRAAGESRGETFRTLHGVSMALYSLTTLILACCGLLLPRVLREDAEVSILPSTSHPERSTAHSGERGPTAALPRG